MSDPTPRQEELLEHALALVQEVGLGGLTVRKLAERVGFTEAALYRHYPNKQALLLALVTTLSEARLLGPMRAIAGETERPAVDRLEAIVGHHLRMIVELQGFPILVMAEAASLGDEALLDRFRAVVGEIGRLVDGLIDELPPGSTRLPRELLKLALFGPNAMAALALRLAPGVAPAPDRLARMPGELIACFVGDPTEAPR